MKNIVILLNLCTIKSDEFECKVIHLKPHHQILSHEFSTGGVQMQFSEFDSVQEQVKYE